MPHKQPARYHMEYVHPYSIVRLHSFNFHPRRLAILRSLIFSSRLPVKYNTMVTHVSGVALRKSTWTPLTTMEVLAVPRHNDHTASQSVKIITDNYDV